MKSMERLIRNTFWYFVVSLATLAFYELAPLGTWEMLAGILVLDAVLWVAIAALRFRLHV